MKITRTFKLPLKRLGISLKYVFFALMITFYVDSSYAQNSSGSHLEKFVIFARETSTGDWDEMRAAIWEFNPYSKGKSAIERKFVFGKSSWSPSLFFSLMDSDLRLNGWVRIQTGEKLRDNDPFKVLLYKVDYQSWKVEKILEAPQIHPVGVAGDLAYLEKVGDLVRLNLATSETASIEANFKILYRQLKTALLVRPAGASGSSVSYFDLAQGKQSFSFSLPSTTDGWIRHAELSPSGRHLAVVSVEQRPISSVSDAKVFEEPAKLVIVDVNKEGANPFVTNICACAYPWMSSLPQYWMWFTDEDHLKYTSTKNCGNVIGGGSQKDEGCPLQEMTVDLRTGGISTEPLRGYDSISKSTIWIPDYLKGKVIRDQRELAHAFLKYKGLKYTEPAVWPDMRERFSADGRRFLLRMLSSEESGSFLYGDLETKELRRVEIPADLKHCNDFEIISVAR